MDAMYHGIPFLLYSLLYFERNRIFHEAVPARNGDRLVHSRSCRAQMKTTLTR